MVQKTLGKKARIMEGKTVGRVWCIDREDFSNEVTSEQRNQEQEGEMSGFWEKIATTNSKVGLCLFCSRNS